MAPRRRLARGLAVIALVVVVGGVGLRAYSGVPLRDYETLYVAASAVGNLRSHDPVRIAGVRVGQVEELRISADGRARVALQLEPDAPALRSDTKVAVRAAGLLGARYVELVPGERGEPLGDGATIRAEEDALTFGLPEMLDTFDAETRRDFGHMIREFGTGMLANGEELNDALRTSSVSQEPTRALAEDVLARPGAARRLFPSVERMAAAFAASGDDWARLFSPAATAMQPFADRRDSVRAALGEAPAALRSADTGLTRGRLLLRATRLLSVAVNATLPSAPSALESTTAFLRASRLPLRRTRSLLLATRPAIPATLRMTDALEPTLEPVRQTFADLTPMVAHMGEHGCDIRHWAAVMRSITGISASPGGEVGPLGQFRFQLIPSPAENAGNDAGAERIRHRYPPPCAYLDQPGAAGAGRGGDD